MAICAEFKGPTGNDAPAGTGRSKLTVWLALEILRVAK
jgi:hypothetical protein